MERKPWCDYSNSTGKPGKPEFGTERTDGRSSVFCDGLHDGLLVVDAVGFSDHTKVPPNSNVGVLIRANAGDKESTA